jgi:uncharacterized protein
MFENRLTTEAELREVYRPPMESIESKIHTELDHHSRAHIALSPFVIIGTSAPNGTADVSPKGGPPGFVTVLDDGHLAIGDLSGNNLLDTLTNIAAGSGVGVIFLVPGNDVTLRVNGHACITTDESVLDACAVKDRRPKTAIGVTITEQFMHCAKAFRRSGLWDPTAWPADDSLASLGRIVSDGLGLEEDVVPAIEDMLEKNYEETMWEPGGDA